MVLTSRPLRIYKRPTFDPLWAESNSWGEDWIEEGSYGFRSKEPRGGGHSLGGRPVTGRGGTASSADDQRVRIGLGERLPGRSPARGDGGADQPHAGQHADGNHGRGG